MKKGRKAQGQIRESQLLTTFGPGAMVDLPDYSVVIGGLEHWTAPQRAIHEPRLEAKVAELLGQEEVKLYAPPTDEHAADGVNTGVTAWRFPEWYLAQYEQPRGAQFRGRARPLVHASQLEKGRFRYEKRRHPVVPVRFVRACAKGHLSDIDWRRFVHGKKRQGETGCQRQLWLEELGTTGDFSELYVRCECGKSKPMSQAYPSEGNAYPLGPCGGERPWLGRYNRELCVNDDEKATPARLLIRSASNAYFPQSLSVIHIPDKSAALQEAVAQVWEDHLQFVEDEADVDKERKRPKVAAALEGFSSADVWKEVQRRTSAEPGQKATPKIRAVELETLLDLPEELSQDVPYGDFYARAFGLPSVPPWLEDKLHCLVLVHRLKEVKALVGFTRFEPQSADIEGELDIEGLNRAPLSLEPDWFPAVENNGEGFFLAFRSEAIKAWTKRSAPNKRLKELEAAFQVKAQRDGQKDARWPGGAYVLLHSLSHLLITAISLECGYAASSIRERIYLGEEACGILLHTGTSDAEGTLGGIVQVGRHVDRHLRRALELGRLCGNDPVCAEHRPDDANEERFLHGACCHGCLLIAEPSCERHNEHLDRALVVPTVSCPDAAFFDDESFATEKG